MASKDFKTNAAVEPVVLDTTIIDTHDCEALTFAFSNAAASVVVITEGDDSALADGVEADTSWIIGDLTFTADGTQLLGYVGKKRYVKINITDPVANTSVFAIKSSLHFAPSA